MAELLLELFSEEIPARMQPGAQGELLKRVGEALTGAGLSFEAARGFATPRRIGLVIEGLPLNQPDTEEERKGPRPDAPDQALMGAAAGVGLKAVDPAFLRGLTADGPPLTLTGEFGPVRIERRAAGKTDALFFIRAISGRPVRDLLADLLPPILDAFPWPKSMRWGAKPERWVRPLQRILCLFDGAPVAFTFAGITAGSETEGHRFLAPGPLAVTSAAAHAARLAGARVVLDPEERARRVAEGANALASGAGLTLVDDPGLVREVTGLVEWPVPLLGGIDPAFMGLPEEVLVTSMRSHQRYFALRDRDGRLAPRFVVVSNMETADGGAAIVAGNERVLRARLSDAAFFWDQDRKARLDSRVEKLAERIFHARLGTDRERVERIRALAAALCDFIPGAARDKADRAALLAKADLTTGMVGEFPELQGIMGRYYAHHDGEDAAVADAIAEHYAPQGPGDACPTRPVSVAVALADKLDTLTGFWAIDEKPTGSKDPYALRRAALGVLRLIIENRLRLKLTPILLTGFAQHGAAHGPDLELDLRGFFADRLKVHLREQGVRHDCIAAVFALGGEDDIVRLLARVEALSAFLASDDGLNLLAAFRRAANIVRIEAKKDGVAFDGPVDPALLELPQEKELAEALAQAEAGVAEAVAAERFADAMAALARLRGPVDRFFDDVTVNAERADLRRNRLHLLSRIGATMGRLADFSRIEGNTP